MSFLSPLFLLGLGLLAPLVAVYLLKVRPRRHPTPALFLWDQVFSQKKANALLQRLRDLFSLLLLALAAAALVLAAAELRFGGDDRDVLVVIDRSVSMSADADPATPGRSRFDEAVERARGLVQAASGSQRVAVATADDRLRFASFLTDRPRRLREALDGLTPGEVENAPAALAGLRDVAGLAGEGGLRVVLLTDGVGAVEVPEGVEVLRVGRGAASNLGLTAADLVATGNGQAALFFAAVNAGPEPVLAELTLRAAEPENAPPLKVLPLTLAPGENPARLSGVLAAPGRYLLRLGRVDGQADGLAADNEAFLSLAAPRPLRVAVSAADRYFFETAVNAFARTGDAVVLADSGEPADLGIARGLAPGAEPADADAPPLTVLFAPTGPGPGVASVGEPLPAPLPQAVIPGHPVLRFLPAEALPFAGARDAVAAPGSAVLVADAGGAPLLWQHREVDASGGSRVTLVVNLDPAAADFVLSPFFPVLVQSAALHLGGRSTPPPATFATGDLAPLPGLRPGEVARVRFSDPAGPELETDQPVRLDAAGFSEAVTPGGTWDLPASVLHRRESLLAAAAADVDVPEVSLAGGHPPWFWLTALALLVVVAEEWLYHRRKVG